MIELAIGYLAGVGSAVAVVLGAAFHLRHRYQHDAEEAISQAGKAMQGAIEAEKSRRDPDGRTAGKGWSRDV